MATAARMHGALERVALEGSFSNRIDDGNGREAAECLAAIEEVLAAAEREESWPRFINVLRARGPELRERMLRLIATRSRAREAAVRSLPRPLLARLAERGLGDESQGMLDHAQRVMAGARSIRYLLEERGSDDVPPCPKAREHALEGEKAAWMYTFALAELGRVAAGATAIERPATEFSVTLAVESARDAYAHWATVLELVADTETVLDPPHPPEDHPMQ